MSWFQSAEEKAKADAVAEVGKLIYSKFDLQQPDGPFSKDRAALIHCNQNVVMGSSTLALLIFAGGGLLPFPERWPMMQRRAALVGAMTSGFFMGLFFGSGKCLDYVLNDPKSDAAKAVRSRLRVTYPTHPYLIGHEREPMQQETLKVSNSSSKP